MVLSVLTTITALVRMVAALLAVIAPSIVAITRLSLPGAGAGPGKHAGRKRKEPRHQQTSRQEVEEFHGLSPVVGRERKSQRVPHSNGSLRGSRRDSLVATLGLKGTLVGAVTHVYAVGELTASPRAGPKTAYMLRGIRSQYHALLVASGPWVQWQQTSVGVRLAALQEPWRGGLGHSGRSPRMSLPESLWVERLSD